jgi:O-antigen/teichoic acid export membrane protein
MIKKGGISDVIGGGLVLQAGYLTGKVFRIILQIVLTRWLGAAKYGLYALGTGFSDLITCFGSMGHFGVIIRFAPIYIDKNQNDRVRGLIRTSFVLSQAIVVPLAILLFLCADKIAISYFCNPELALVLKIISAGLPLCSVFMQILAITIACQRLEYTTIVNDITQVLVQLLLVVIVFWAGWGLIGVTATFVAATAFSVVVGIFLVNKCFPGFLAKSTNMFSVAEAVSYSVPVTIIAFAQIMFLNMNKILIGIYHAPAEVGIFNVVFLIGYQLPLLTGALVQSFSPSVSLLHHKKDFEDLERYYRTMARLNNLILFFPVLLIIAFNSELLSFFGPGFILGGEALALLAAVFFIDSIPGNLCKFFEITGYQKMESINSASSVLLNLSLGLLLIPHLGFKGAIISVSLTMVIISAIRVAELLRKFGFFPLTVEYSLFLVYAVCASTVTYVCARYVGFIPRVVVVACLMAGTWFWIRRLKMAI